MNATLSFLHLLRLLRQHARSSTICVRLAASGWASEAPGVVGGRPGAVPTTGGLQDAL